MRRLLAIALLALLPAARPAFQVRAAVPGPLNYTALGDSLANGILDLSRGGYVPRYATYVQADTGARVQLNNLAENGWTSRQLLDALRSNAAFRNAVANSQVVTWDIGGNDFLRVISSYRGGACGGADNQDCFRSAAATFKANWSAITAEILALRSTSNTMIRTMDVYNPFVNAQKASDSWPADGGLNDFQVVKPLLDDVNHYIAATAAANNIPCAKVYQAFNGVNGDEDAGDKGYISPLDYTRVHPSDLGHRVIADLFRNLGYAPLTGPAPADAPVLLTEEGTNRAAAVDSVTLLRDPFPVFTPHNFSADGRTRVTLFAANLTLLPGEDASAVAAQAEDSAHRIYALAVEYVGKVPNVDALTQVIVRLPDELKGGGDVSVSLSLRGASSNRATVSIKPSAGT